MSEQRRASLRAPNRLRKKQKQHENSLCAAGCSAIAGLGQVCELCYGAPSPASQRGRPGKYFIPFKPRPRSEAQLHTRPSCGPHPSHLHVWRGRESLPLNNKHPKQAREVGAAAYGLGEEAEADPGSGVGGWGEHPWEAAAAAGSLRGTPSPAPWAALGLAVSQVCLWLPGIPRGWRAPPPAPRCPPGACAQHVGRPPPRREERPTRRSPRDEDVQLAGRAPGRSVKKC